MALLPAPICTGKQGYEAWPWLCLGLGTKGKFCTLHPRKSLITLPGVVRKQLHAQLGSVNGSAPACAAHHIPHHVACVISFNVGFQAVDTAVAMGFEHFITITCIYTARV
jgi:hypothetical protein